MKVLLKYLERDMKVVVDGKVVVQTHLLQSHANLQFHRLSSLLTRTPNLRQSMLLTGPA
ncbi:hypothetical protein BDM02DRAFT_3116027 [Thelephora ganbajun]|uniref:Uncharacterized protein n=1 Tax=Thelephora ganbajun TaxID=370292 RepID=A0ACB6ZF89_THEGA|nr:hypothetical protein BDM02DRAFT_3116027 [Thelephora ganbajun]